MPGYHAHGGRRVRTESHVNVLQTETKTLMEKSIIKTKIAFSVGKEVVLYKSH